MTWFTKEKYTYDTFSDYPNETPEVRKNRLFTEFDAAVEKGLAQLQNASNSKELNKLINTAYSDSSNRFTYCVNNIKKAAKQFLHPRTPPMKPFRIAMRSWSVPFNFSRIQA